MPYANEHACRLKDPSGYSAIRRKNCDIKSNGKCIDVVYGIKRTSKSEIQAYRYPKEVWSATSARSHCNSHKGSFEPAGNSDAQDSSNNVLQQDASNRKHGYCAITGR